MKSLLTEILRDFHDYEDHFMVDEEIYEVYSQKIIDALLQPCGMTEQDAYKRFDLNKSIILKGQNANILSNPLSHADEIFFQRLEATASYNPGTCIQPGFQTTGPPWALQRPGSPVAQNIHLGHKGR